MTLHFLHIGKTGGTAIIAALAPYAAEIGLQIHPHETKLAEIPETDPIAFTVRDPVSRYVSGFNDRMRQGRPRYNSVWTSDEILAFARYKSANELAESLSGKDRPRAVEAMNAIAHVKRRLTHTVNSAQIASHNVIWIGFQESLAEDFELLKAELALPGDLHLPSDDFSANRAPQSENVELSEKAVSNLQTWYAADLNLYNRLRQRRERLARRVRK